MIPDLITPTEWILIEDTLEEKIFKKKKGNAIIIAEWNKRKRKYDLHFKLA